MPNFEKSPVYVLFRTFYTARIIQKLPIFQGILAFYRVMKDTNTGYF